MLNWVLEGLEAEGRVFTKKGSVRGGTPEIDLSAEEQKARTLLISLLKGRLFQPPSERELQAKIGVSTHTIQKVTNLLIEDGEVIRLEPGLIMHQDAVEAARTTVTDYLREHGEATASDLKNILGTTRKYAVPLLELLDRIGVTRRKGDKRTLTG